MILNDRQIKARQAGWDSHNLIRTKPLFIDPFNSDQVEASSYDVRVGDTFCVYDFAGQFEKIVDPLDPEVKMRTEGPVEKFVLQPHSFALATTVEYWGFPDDLVGHLEGKSSLGRMGLMVHVTAGYIDPGFQGQATLELVNVAPWPFVIHAGMLIGHMTFHQMSEPAEKPYGKDGSKYQGQVGPTPSQYWRNYPNGVVSCEEKV